MTSMIVNYLKEEFNQYLSENHHPFKFKNNFSKQHRKQECALMRQKHSDRIPVIVENSFIKTTAELDKHKYLVPMDLTVGQFMYVIRKRLKLDSSTTIYFIINGYIPSIGSIMKEVYESYKDKDDGFLYILVKDENVFG